MLGEVLAFGEGEAREDRGRGERVEGVLVDLGGLLVFGASEEYIAHWGFKIGFWHVYTHLCYPGAQKRAHEKLEPLEFGLVQDEAEVGLGVHVARLLLDEFNLLAGDDVRHALASWSVVVIVVIIVNACCTVRLRLAPLPLRPACNAVEWLCRWIWDTYAMFPSVLWAVKSFPPAALREWTDIDILRLALARASDTAAVSCPSSASFSFPGPSFIVGFVRRPGQSTRAACRRAPKRHGPSK